MAQLFKECILEFDGCFKKIVFAIFDDHNACRRHNPKGNLAPFEEEFEGYNELVAKGQLKSLVSGEKELESEGGNEEPEEEKGKGKGKEKKGKKKPEKDKEQEPEEKGPKDAETAKKEEDRASNKKRFLL